MGGDVRLVGHQDNRDARLVKPFKHTENVFGLIGGQIAGGFVRENYFGAVGQGAGDGHALLLPAGQFVGFVSHAVRQPHLRQQVPGPFVPVGDRRINHGKQDVVQGAGTGQEIEHLENESNGFGTERRAFVIRESRHVPSGQTVRTGGRSIQNPHDLHERRFARPRRTHDGHKLAFFDRQVNALQDFQIFLRPGQTIGARDAFQFNDGH